ncbi:MAG: response regulator [Thiolinea sp.]
MHEKNEVALTPYHTILLVEDDRRLADLIGEYLQKQGLQVEVEYRGDTAVQRILDLQPDLLILDLMLPGLDGLEVCRQVRPYYTAPILMLTAKDEDVDQVVGLELGADDYVIKPVQPRVLLARIRTLLRRVQVPVQPATKATALTGAKQSVLDFGRLHVTPSARAVTLDTEPVELTTQEYDLLYLLAAHAGEVLSRDAILGALTGIEYDGLDRSVDVRISRLRRLLERDPANPQGIKTVRGQGYLFVAQGWAE